MSIIPRIKQLFLTKSKAMLMDWHVTNKNEDGVMINLVDLKNLANCGGLMATN
jgi:hypothetical protein